MYVGRIVTVGRTGGKSWVAYRVSSRAFPNRRASVHGDKILVAPRDLSDLAKNPYIAYDCVRLVGDVAVVSNGTHTDMIAEKIDDGTIPLDAIALSLLAYGYERDELDTPRIAGVVQEREAWLGIARKDELRTARLYLEEDSAFQVATYEATDFQPAEMAGGSAASVAKAAFDQSFERPVCSAAAFWMGEEYELAVYNPE